MASISTTETLQPVADATGGGVVRIGDGSDVPAIDPTRNVRSGGNRLSLRLSGETVLTGVDRLPLFYGFLGLGLLLLAVGATWYREGR